jgi:branched-chain amino acid transport system ATP-binding protein
VSAVLEARALTRRFGGITAVDGVSFAVRQGEILGVIGPNGSGKSTLFNCLLGQLRPSAGQVLLDGRDVTGLRPAALNRLGVSRTFQLLQVFPRLSVRENLILAGQEHVGSRLSRLFGAADAGLGDAAARMLGLFGLAHLADALAGGLSYGQQKLLDVAMAFMAGPRLVLLDEPAGGVNLTMLAQLREQLRALNAAQGATFVVIEHNMDFVMSLCTRVLVLAEGRVIAAGLPAEVRENPAVIEAILRLAEVTGGYGRMSILNGCSFDVARAAITTVIGPNGAGKSTTFKAIFGMLTLREGRIWFDGRDITGWPPGRLLALGICYVPQGRNIFPELSVRANLELGGVALGSAAAMRPRVEAALDRFAVLRQKAAAQASTLSGGQQKLLEIARGLIAEPRLMLIDEPSIGLSPLMVKEVFATLQGLRDGGMSILMVEQNARSALEISDFGLVLEGGRARMSGPAREILQDPRVAKLFLGAEVAL